MSNHSALYRCSVLLVLFVAATAAATLTSTSCSTLRDAPRVAEMDSAEYLAWQSRAVAQIGALADVAIEQGDLSPQDAASIADTLGGFAIAEPGSSVSLVSGLGLDAGGYGGLALTLALTELDAELNRQGLVMEGFISERGRSFMQALSERMRAAIPVEE